MAGSRDATGASHFHDPAGRYAYGMHGIFVGWPERCSVSPARATQWHLFLLARVFFIIDNVGTAAVVDRRRLVSLRVFGVALLG